MHAEAHLCPRCGDPARGRPSRSTLTYCTRCRPRSGKHATCSYCGTSTYGERFCSTLCRDIASWERRAPPLWVRDCAECGQPFAVLANLRQTHCSAQCKTARKRRQGAKRGPRTAHHRQQRHRRRAARYITDLRAADLKAMLAARTYCPLCRRRMVDAHHHPRAKHIDHIIPIAAGGTHTRGNIRVICRSCNLTRPIDGSDVVGQVTLWAQLPGGANNHQQDGSAKEIGRAHV